MSNIKKSCEGLEGKDKIICNIENSMIDEKNNACIEKENMNIDMNSKIDIVDSKYDAKKSSIRKNFTKCMNVEKNKCDAFCDKKWRKQKCKNECNTASELSFFSF